MAPQLVAKVYPPRSAIAEVIEIASRFWADHPDEYIAIHCAYGARLPSPSPRFQSTQHGCDLIIARLLRTWLRWLGQA